MKAFITGICILLALSLIFQPAAGSITMTGVSLQRMEEKMAQALQGIGYKQPVPIAEQRATGQGPQSQELANESESNVSAAEIINETERNLTVNKTALASESKDGAIDESELTSEALESDILAEVAAMNTTEAEEKLEAAESAPQTILPPSNMSASETALNISAANVTKIDANATKINATLTAFEANLTKINATMTAIQANMTAAGANMTMVNMSSRDLLPFNATPANLTINATGINATEINATRINSTDVKQPIELKSMAKGSSNSKSSTVPCKNCSNQASQNIGGSTSAAVDGMYSIQSAQHTMGGTDIKSNTFLSGDFEVDKNVQFQDKGF